MRRNKIFASLIILTVVVSYAFINVGIKDNNELNAEIKWGNFDEGMRDAKQLNKKMIIDVYTDWCGWCKKMDKSTYSDPEVSNYINNNFVAVKLNAESQNPMNFMGQKYTERQLAQGFGINSFPSTIFLDEKQQPITVVPGYLESKNMLSILKYIKDDIYLTKSFEEYIKVSKN